MVFGKLSMDLFLFELLSLPCDCHSTHLSSFQFFSPLFMAIFIIIIIIIITFPFLDVRHPLSVSSHAHPSPIHHSTPSPTPSTSHSSSSTPSLYPAHIEFCYLCYWSNPRGYDLRTSMDHWRNCYPSPLRYLTRCSSLHTIVYFSIPVWIMLFRSKLLTPLFPPVCCVYIHS